ncbi:uncharacterized protein LOC127866879 isoform X2 [Dreissena polymorpha]|uniref:Uncharacterized protein n=1 Tax=Dreissena polymorpha TaxID=45954 RepID=A0A9D4RFI2_DREPO|nr:uncharacterized protein LOC127866879 isoform X2 [Dreissena polymorpha]KAH3864435.1 hypothetical protein DPMN_027453 [Dreissena polymorpha]
MHVSEHNTLASYKAASGALPPLVGSKGNSVFNLKQTGKCGPNPVPATTATMVSQNQRGSSSKSLIYRSIPPKPHTFTLSDMIGESLSQNRVNKKLGLTGSSSSEFAKRFISRPTTQPKVIEFNVGKISAQKRRRGINGFFPPVKLRGTSSAKFTPPSTHTSEPVAHAMSAPPVPTATTTTAAPGSALQLVPTSYSEVRPKSASRSISRASRTSRRSLRQTPESVRTAPAQDSNIVYPETFEFDELSTMLGPKRVLPRRDLPWVFRYKVKRNMNELSKIMSTKQPPLVDV